MGIKDEDGAGGNGTKKIKTTKSVTVGGKTYQVDAEDSDAVVSTIAIFEKYNLGSLGPRIVEFYQQGYSNDTVQLLLQDDPEYKKRFAANDARVKAGFPVLSPKEYLATEDAYRAILQDAGLPKGFYDDTSDFQKLIAADLSASAVKRRVDAAAKAVDNADPYYKEALQNMYGLDAGHMIAHLLDPEAALPLIEKQSKAVEYGAAAARQGLTQAPTSQYEAYASGVGTGVGAETGMAQVAEITPGLTTLGQISGDQYNQQTAQDEVFGGLASARRKRQKLTQEEETRFTGRSNVESASLGSGMTGQF